MLPRIRQLLGFSRQSTALFSAFLLVCLLIVYFWWPLVEEYLSYMDDSRPWYANVDWLLLGIFTFMSLTIMARADLRTDGMIVFVGLLGGLAIESWGTQTSLWQYYTAERPPLWIIPAWPIASLSIDRLTRLLAHFLPRGGAYRLAYWLTFPAFLALMLAFVAPTADRSLTWAALAICVLLVISPPDHRRQLLVFIAGSALGYFLERWGTTRACWTYYTGQTPPVFAVFAHGMAAVAFWRAGLILERVAAAARRGAPFKPPVPG
jgi:hypothetical protein